MQNTVEWKYHLPNTLQMPVVPILCINADNKLRTFYAHHSVRSHTVPNIFVKKTLWFFLRQ